MGLDDAVGANVVVASITSEKASIERLLIEDSLADVAVARVTSADVLLGEADPPLEDVLLGAG